MKEERKKGYTIIGIILTIAIISILAAMVVPRFDRGFITKLNIYNTTHRLVADLRLTRRLAITKARNYVLEFFDNWTKYKIYEEARGPGGVEEKTIPPEVTCSGTNKFTFTKLGTLDSLVNGSLSLSGDTFHYSITVYRTTGRAKLEENE